MPMLALKMGSTLKQFDADLKVRLNLRDNLMLIDAWEQGEYLLEGVFYHDWFS